MKNILCFGDSNTYGLKPDGTGRYDFSMRYPGVLQLLLGNEYHIIEEGCPGRTTVFEDVNRPFKRGIDYFKPCLVSHTPLDFVIIMLGTNDCKTAYHATAEEISLGMLQFVEAARAISKQTPQILIVAPAYLGDTVWISDHDFNKESIQVSKELANEYKKLSQKLNCLFLDASELAVTSSIDQEHLDEVGHNALAKAISKIILN